MADAEANLRRYLGERRPTARYSSFDYCFNYFRSYAETGRLHNLVEPPHVQTACLQLGFYLASWGMFRGRAELLSRSVKCFEAAVEAIVAAPGDVWDIDADRYTDDAVDVLFEVRDVLRRALPGGHSDTLVTKTMLGVFGCVPAFDRYFKNGLGVATFGRKSLATIAAFYKANAELVERNRVPTLAFETGQPTERLYTRAKVVDMVFFIEGSR